MTHGRYLPQPDGSFAKLLATHEARAAATVRELPGTDSRSSTTPQQGQQLLLARQSDEACVQTMRDMFTGPLGRNEEMAREILARSKAGAGGDGEAAREAAMHVAAAMAAALGADGARARTAWGNIIHTSPAQALPVAQARDVHALERALASHPVSFEALWALKGPAGTGAVPAHAKEDFKFALQACGELISRGAAEALGPQSRLAIDDLAGYARGRVRSEAVARIGGQEAADMLASKTLLLAHDGLTQLGQIEAPDQCAVWMAWRNGFRTSGPGSDFNHAVQRMHQFGSWTELAEKNTSGKLDVIGRALHGLGGKATPLAAMEHGLMGADLGTLQAERSKFDGAVQEAIGLLREQISSTIQRTGPGASSAAGSVKLQQQMAVADAMLAHWQQHPPSRGERIDAATREHLLQQLEASAEPDKTFDSAAAARQLAKPFRVTQLVDWQKKLLAVDPQLPVEPFVDAVKAARDAQSGKGAQPAKKGELSREDMREIAHAALATEGVEFSSQRRKGVDLKANASLLSQAISLTSVGPGVNVRYTTARAATVRLGTTNEGSEIFLGSGSRQHLSASATLSAGVGVATSLRENSLTFNPSLKYGNQEATNPASVTLPLAGAGVSIGARALAESEDREGISIRCSSRVPDHREQLAAVLDFLMDLGGSRDAKGAHQASFTWERFADHFFEQDLTVNAMRGRDSTVRWNLGAVASAGVTTPLGSIGPTLSAGVEGTRHASSAAQGGPGNPVRMEARREAVTQSSVQFSALQGTTGAARFSGDIPDAGLPSLSIRAQHIHATSGAGDIRLQLQDGRVQADLSSQKKEFRNSAEFLAHVQSTRSEWGGSLAQTSADLDKFMDDVSRLNRMAGSSPRIFHETRRLTDAAADAVSFLLAQASLTQADKRPHVDAAGHPGPAHAAMHAVASVLERPESWVPSALGVSERVAKNSQSGLNLGLVLDTKVGAASLDRQLLPRLELPPSGASQPVSKGEDGSRNSS